MKKTIFILASLAIATGFNSCKKGCTNPKAYNYKKKKKKDNGSCELYKSVTLSSIDIKTVPEYNSNGAFWDSGNGDDLDNDNTRPDLFVKFRVEGGYSDVSNSYYPTINPSNVNKTKTLVSPLVLSEWDGKVFWAYFYEIDNPTTNPHYELMDSVEIRPFLESASDKFRDTLEVSSGDISFTANMQWNK